MDYSVEYRKGGMPLSAFQQKYQDCATYLTYCQQCPNYNTVWSCPPLPFDVADYLEKFQWMYVIGAKINLSPQVIKAADTAEKVKAMGWDIVVAVKLAMEERLRRLEQQLPGSVSFSSGGCNLCRACSRKEGAACRRPEKMRYSLDAFGFNLTAIANDMLGIEIQWCKERLPDYFTLVHGLATTEKISDRMWERWEDAFELAAD
ncbi:DUF2284 domain-containing protein [Selenomonas sp.]|uniref:DUF2284 domain-containing protein n=1 Tax=Selenomonas sp. TaxID=2053611 RepID=UPI0025DD470F|nr:DUF2284 domain-containing protein [Selenomonas sp.]MBQ1867165.1 hypothetical protein [Selenomonas sp.]